MLGLLRVSADSTVSGRVGDTANRMRITAIRLDRLREQGKLLAYHDRSDGGLWAAACEMAFAGHMGVSLNVDILVTPSDGINDSRAEYGDSKNWAGQVSERRNELTLRALFNEELGVVIQFLYGNSVVLF